MAQMFTVTLAASLLAFACQAAAFSSVRTPTPRRCSSSPQRAAPRTCSITSLSAVREATFGMGCFWEPAESLLKQPGILGTTVGYTGAPPNKPPPTYDSVCFGKDWVEAVRVAYDDEVVSYDQVLDYFFKFQKPAYTRQYASVIFANDAAEEKEANQWKKASATKQLDSNLSYDIVEIEKSSPFYKAEEYHQRYWEKQRLRFLIGFALIAGESGAYDNFLAGALGNREQLFGLSFDSIFGAVFLIGAAWTLLERLVARDVKELGQGDFMEMVMQEKS